MLLFKVELSTSCIVAAVLKVQIFLVQCLLQSQLKCKH